MDDDPPPLTAKERREFKALLGTALQRPFTEQEFARYYELLLRENPEADGIRREKLVDAGLLVVGVWRLFRVKPAKAP